MMTGKSEGTRTFPPCPGRTGSLPYPVAGTLPSGRESTPSEKPEFDHLGTLRALRMVPSVRSLPWGWHLPLGVLQTEMQGRSAAACRAWEQKSTWRALLTPSRDAARLPIPPRGGH